MQKSRAISLAAATAVMVGAGVVCSFISRTKDPVLEHLEAIEALERSWAAPSSVLDYFRPQTWRWFLHGRPALRVSLQKIDDHKKALVDLGYYEKRIFTLHQRTLDRNGYPKFRSLLTNIAFSDPHWSMSTTGDQPSVIFITARPEDMPSWSNIVS
jgi:hypothetical protein